MAKILCNPSIDYVDINEFKYLKDVFVIKNSKILDIGFDSECFTGKLLDITIYSTSFKKGKYTLWIS